MKVEVKDPNRLITQIKVLRETEDCVILYFNMNRTGKRAEFTDMGTIHDDNVHTLIVASTESTAEAEVNISELPFHSDYTVFGESSRYSIFICILWHGEDGKKLTEAPEYVRTSA